MSQEISETDIAGSIAPVKKAITGKYTLRNVALLGLLAAPWIGLFAIARKAIPRQVRAHGWPTITFVGLYRMALNRCVEIEGIEYLPKTGPVILAGNHINKTAMDAMLIGSKILIERGGLVKFVSQADPASRMLKYYVRLMGNPEGVILPIQAGMTTDTMIRFLRHPEAFKREQPILGIFPVGAADKDFETHLKKTWHTSAAVAAFETGASIVPFFVEGLPYHWGPLDMLKAVARSLAGRKVFEFKIRLGAPIRTECLKGERNYAELTECIREAVYRLAMNSYI